MAAIHHLKSKIQMGILVAPLRAIAVLQGITLGILLWETCEHRVLRNQLQTALRELEAIREEEIQLIRSGAPISDPPPGDKAADLVEKPKGSIWYFGWGSESEVTSSFWLLIPLVSVLVFLLLAGKLWIWVNGQREESRVTDSPVAKQQLAKRQLAELRLRQHGIGR